MAAPGWRVCPAHWSCDGPHRAGGRRFARRGLSPPVLRPILIVRARPSRAVQTVSFPHRILAPIISMEGRVERLLSKRLLFGPLALLVAVAFGIRWALVPLSVPTVGPDYGHYLIGANW